MSRIGRRAIPVPDEVEVKIASGSVSVKGPLGHLEAAIPEGIDVQFDEGTKSIQLTRRTDEKRHRALHGLARALVANMVHGVEKGYDRKLKIVGVGYSAQVKGNDLSLQIGFCHPVVMPIPDGLTVETSGPTEIVVKGHDKQLVGQFAANIRGVRPPEPYNGKGIRYDDETVRRKAGKAFVGGGD